MDQFCVSLIHDEGKKLQNCTSMKKSAFQFLVVYAIITVINAKKISVNIKTRSIGCHDACHGCSSFIKVNNVTLTKGTAPGLKIVAISNSTQIVNRIENISFLENNRNKRDELKRFLYAIPRRSIVVFVLHRKCSALIMNWYSLVNEYSSTLNLTRIHTVSHEMGVLIACKGPCPPGTNMDALPIYESKRRGSGPLEVSLNITLEADLNTNEAQTDAEDDELLIIILGVLASCCGVVLFIILSSLCFRYIQSKTPAHQINSCETKTGGKIRNWQKQRKQEKINKAIHNSESHDSKRKEFDNKAFKGDVVRFHVPASGFTSFRHLNQEPPQVRDAPHPTPEDSSRSASTCSSVVSSNRESRIYLEPIDGFHGDHAQLSNQMQSMLKTALMNNRSKSMSHLDVVSTFPSTSSLLFHSRDNLYSTTGQNGDFAEYLVPRDDGAVYKKPSNVQKHEPPEYQPDFYVKTSPRLIHSDTPADNESIKSDDTHHYELPSNHSAQQPIKTTDEHYEMLKKLYKPETYKNLEIDATNL